MYYASGLAVLASASLAIGLYLLKRQVERLPSLGAGVRLRALWAFVQDPVWVLGLVLQTVGYALYMLALTTAPLSIVHTALNGGIVLFVILAVLGLGERVRPIEWCGVGVITGALIVLSLSLSAAPVSSGTAHNLLLFSVGLMMASVLALVLDPAPDRLIGLSIASGLILGLASVYAKGLANAPAISAALTSPYFPLTIGTNIVGFILMQAAFQAGRGVVAMPLLSAISNFVPILGGILVYDEILPDHGPAAILRPLAFVLALAGGTLLAGFGEAAPAATGQPEEVSSR